MGRRILTHPDGPTRSGHERGLAYTLWLPSSEPSGGVVILHGAGSCKENHHDFARAARAAGLAAVAFDQRGHGETGGALDGRAIEDVAAVAALLPPGPVALRGSSMGGYLAIVAAERVGAAAVVAICPAGAEGLLRGLRSGRLGFTADRPRLEALLAEHDLELATRGLQAELLLMHAEGDEQVPVEQSQALAAAAPRARLIAVAGGHHRSVQHDEELQGESLRFLGRAFAAVR
jgi:pimeloyl-ACP methyl ester carboxylesterase